MSRPSEPTDLQVVQFPSEQHWEDWLRSNAETSPGVWIRFAKKASGIPTVTYDEALQVALCHGWIDGLRKSLDERFFLQRFTPRRPRSGWSKRNVGFVEQLIKARRMGARGLREVEAAKADGRWDSASEGPKGAKPHPDFEAALAKNKRAKAFFEKVSKRNQFAIYFRIQTAKRPETRKKRIAEFVTMLAEGRSIYS